ncbi:response regulator transcription factor [Tenacibaculum finnmarkense]|uniref:LytR/AlgR family response regulator transcription factor n=1 Tax=Tenacibaculum finnmarkense TaxID=2781243 RepID=UPI00187BB7A0|nr:LytTR family DNA-binding domain-containing protein [Tenacibaculum finnmarkense]MBE7692211.1 response regulator [Tenacibaculum finnmarkense genomovar finnmarkense]MCG8805138.1 response regulator transcription factor [Tenacibaculum finnmarkense]MCG8855433.1 response regulator transcription factor [Tenacibaculum finnmarkense]MCG8882349.1 response regulator transcription factor [Tenacibaculum finnmarkense]WCC44864.1 LytTR family DNA-binding domain-containing protein [Tenacibaculum finnmarkense]
MLHCIIIEDQPPAQRILKRYIENIEGLILLEIFSDVLKVEQYLNKNKVDLIFLDIHLPKMSGIDFLRAVTNHPKVILTTAFSDYALESYQYNVVDYLLKPISFERFLQAIEKVNSINYENLKDFKLKNEYLNKNETIFIKSGYDHIQLFISDIIAIKSDADYTEISTKNKTYLSKESLKYWLEKLDDTLFCQVHKSYIINVKQIEKVASNSIYINSLIIPLGRAFKKQFSDKFL